MAFNVHHTTVFGTENFARKAITKACPFNNVNLRQNNVLPNPSHTAHAVKESQLKKPSKKPKFDHDGQHYDHGIGDCDVMQY
jgi:hypothetical protein